MSDRGGKRKQEGSGARSHSKKSKYFSSNKQASLPVGARGFLISCLSGKEFQAGQEATRVLLTYYEAALPKADKPVSEGAKQDISSLLASEVADLKDPKQRVLTYHKTNVSGLLFLSMLPNVPGPGPVELIEMVAEDVKRTRECKARLCMRFLPVETICFAGLEEIRKGAAALVAPHFPKDAPCRTFAVQYEHRASVNLNRMEVINAVVDEIAAPPHKANLDKPDRTIIVQVLRSTCAISVVTKYKEYSKLNLRELSNTTEADDTAGPADVADKPAATADAKGEKAEEDAEDAEAKGQAEGAGAEVQAEIAGAEGQAEDAGAAADEPSTTLTTAAKAEQTPAGGGHKQEG